MFVDKITINCWFDKVVKFYEDTGMKKEGKYIHDYAQRIWNVNETGFCLGATSKKILAKRGERVVHEVESAPVCNYHFLKTQCQQC